MEAANMEIYFSGERLEVWFELRRPRRGTLLVTVDAESVSIDGMDYEGDTAVSLPLSAMRRALSAIDQARDWVDTPTAWRASSGKLEVKPVYEPPNSHRIGYELVDAATGERLSMHPTILEAFESAKEGGGADA